MDTLTLSLKRSVLDLPRTAKRIIVMMVDACIVALTVWLAYYLRIGEFLPLIFRTGEFYPLPALVTGIFLSIPTFMIFGLYRTIFRFSGGPALISVTKAVALYGLVFSLIFMMISVPGVPRTIGIIQPILMLVFVFLSRFFARFWLGEFYFNQITRKHIPGTLIYGAGEAGRELSTALIHGRETNVVGFLDDNTKLHGSYLSGLPIFNPAEILNIMKCQNISEILLALPTINRRRRTKILKSLTGLGLAVRTVPSYSDLAKGLMSVMDVRELSVGDILGRDQVEPDEALISQDIKGQIVLVTGAGGSIGRELCLQIFYQKPKHLILLDHSEFALYRIYEKIQNLAVFDGVDIKITPVLGSVLNSMNIDRIIKNTNPQIIFHSAAYKHVPLVEDNKVEGVYNNVIGTLTLAKSAIKLGVKKFVLISTDKAVRPTNVMGASKRVAEMVLQALSTKQQKTVFAIVRFGNVLDSSGSVVPLFRQQIRAGGPITLTHRDVTRYFMTISEAAQLVIQAGAMTVALNNRGGTGKINPGAPVYLLDMGEPIRIEDLARRMIDLSGLSVFDDQTGEGDIEIKITGLRSGEKLYEELFIGDAVRDSAHPKIKYADESFLEWSALDLELKALWRVIEAADEDALNNLLVKLVAGFSPSN